MLTGGSVGGDYNGTLDEFQAEQRANARMWVYIVGTLAIAALIATISCICDGLTHGAVIFGLMTMLLAIFCLPGMWAFRRVPAEIPVVMGKAQVHCAAKSVRQIVDYMHANPEFARKMMADWEGEGPKT